MKVSTVYEFVHTFVNTVWVPWAEAHVQNIAHLYGLEAELTVEGTDVTLLVVLPDVDRTGWSIRTRTWDLPDFSPQVAFRFIDASAHALKGHRR
jgi:hypothetical protein